MAGPVFGVGVEPCSVLTVRSPFVVAFLSDWLAALVFDLEIGDAASGCQNFEHAPAGG